MNPIKMLLRHGALAFLMSLGIQACASTRTVMTTADLIDKAETVVLARCTNETYTRDANALFGKFAFYTFEIEDTIKGTPPISHGVLTLRMGGTGRVGAPFSKGERLILFLGKVNADGYPTLFGTSTTMLRVGALSQRFPHPALAGSAVVKGNISGLDVPAGNRPVLLEDFLRAAHARVNKQKGQ